MCTPLLARPWWGLWEGAGLLVYTTGPLCPGDRVMPDIRDSREGALGTQGSNF